MTAANAVLAWISEIRAAKKREKDYRKDGERILEIYDGSKSSSIPFNILFSNTETMLPALYSTIPMPVVERRFKDADPLGKAAAEAGKRMLSFLINTNVDGYETFDEGMRAATLDALLPGRGVTSIKYDAETAELPPVEKDEDEVADPAEPAEDAGISEEPDEYKKSELVCPEARSWNRVLFGYAKKWSKVPWAAYEEDIDKQEAERLFGAKVANLLKYTRDEDDEDKEKKEEDDKGARKTARIYQIWDKDGGRKIRYIAEQYKDDFLKVEDDPLGLTGFFNCPKPLQFIEKSNDLKPTSLYSLYETQAKELNELTRRILRITKAIKARGIYDGGLGTDIERLMDADENSMIPTETASAMAAEKGFDNAIWFWPVDKLIVVLQQLYQARETCKQVIYEITGIADIMRGVSQASETLGAQKIKQSWGTLRLKRLQYEVQRYARDLLRMMLEVAATKFSPETWAKMTGLPFVTAAEKQQAQSVAMAAQQQAQQQAAMMPPPQPGQPPQPPPQPQLDEQTQHALSAPVWEDVIGLLRDDVQRAYRIDIETNSTIDPEASEDQKNIADLMNAIAQFLNGMGPLIQQQIMPFEAAKAMLLAIVRRYRFGSEIEDQIQGMQPPKPPDEGASQAQQQHEQAMQAQDLQAKQQDNAARAQENQQKAQIAAQQTQLEMQKMARQAEYDAAEHAAKMEEIAAKRELTQVVTASKIAAARATAASRAQAQPGA